MIHRLRSGWTTLKILRVALGGLILYSSINTGHVSGMIIGGIFTLFALFTDGVCCAGGSCYSNRSFEMNKERIDNTEYEEVGRQ